MITDESEIDNHCQIEFFFSDFGLSAKKHVLSKGDTIGKHIHPYSHLSILGYGSVRVNTPEGSKVYDAGDCIEIKKDTEHVIHALEDSAWFCIHVDKEN